MPRPSFLYKETRGSGRRARLRSAPLGCAPLGGAPRRRAAAAPRGGGRLALGPPPPPPPPRPRLGPGGSGARAALGPAERGAVSCGARRARGSPSPPLLPGARAGAAGDPGGRRGTRLPGQVGAASSPKAAGVARRGWCGTDERENGAGNYDAVGIISFMLCVSGFSHTEPNSG